MTLPHHARRRLLGWAAAPWLLPALSACTGLGGPRVITLDEADLNRLVGRAFPLQRRLMEVLEVEAAAPRLQLLPERNRLAVAVSLSIRNRLSLRQQRGTLDFDSALRFEPSDQSVHLLQVRVQSVALAALPAGALAPGTPASGVERLGEGASANDSTDSLASRLGRPLAERLLENLTVWRLGAERQAQLKAAGLAPGAVTVTARGVEITLARLPG